MSIPKRLISVILNSSPSSSSKTTKESAQPNTLTLFTPPHFYICNASLSNTCNINLSISYWNRWLKTMQDFLPLCFVALLLLFIQEASCSIKQQKQAEFEERLQQIPVSSYHTQHSSNKKLVTHIWQIFMRMLCVIICLSMSQIFFFWFIKRQWV